MVGNPNRSTGYFYDSFNKNIESWQTMTVSCLDADTVDPQYIEDMKRQYGEDSNVFRVRVLGLPPETDDNAIMGRALVESAIDREVDPIEVFTGWGIDDARHGRDRGALCKRKGNVINAPKQQWGGKELREPEWGNMAETEGTRVVSEDSEM